MRGIQERAEMPISLETMTDRTSSPSGHEHVAKRIHLVQQRAGIPYEVERQVCTACARVLDEKPLKRTAA